jgi:thiol-disulfide isomerase/thioredoxin
VDHKKSIVTPARFAEGMTFDQYIEYIGTPENLRREAGWLVGPRRMDFSAILRERYVRLRLTDEQVEAIRWLAAQPSGPAKVLMISEEWSSDCRRDLPTLGRLAEAGGLELRIFPRDGQKVGRDPKANPADSPNADIVNEFLNVRDGQTYQSVPVVAFYTDAFDYLYHYTEFPAIYHKDRVMAAIRAAKPGETAEETFERGIRDWRAVQDSPFFRLWACAAVDEMLSVLHERVVVGSVWR